MEEKNIFNYEAALNAIQAGQPMLGEKGVLTPLIKNLTEAALEAELDSHPRFKRIGLPDVFPEKYGSQASLMDYYNVTAERLAEEVTKLSLKVC